MDNIFKLQNTIKQSSLNHEVKKALLDLDYQALQNELLAINEIVAKHHMAIGQGVFMRLQWQPITEINQDNLADGDFAVILCDDIDHFKPNNSRKAMKPSTYTDGKFSGDGQDEYGYPDYYYGVTHFCKIPYLPLP